MEKIDPYKHEEKYFKWKSKIADGFRGLSLSELCRHKLKEMPTLNKIEFMLQRFEKLINDKKKYFS